MGDHRRDVVERARFFQVISHCEGNDPASESCREEYYSHFTTLLRHFRDIYPGSDNDTKFKILDVIRNLTRDDIHLQMEMATSVGFGPRMRWLITHDTLFGFFRADGLLDNGGIPDAGPVVSLIQATGPVQGDEFDSIPPPEPTAPIFRERGISREWLNVLAHVYHPEPITEFPPLWPPAHRIGYRPRDYQTPPLVEESERSYSPIGEAAGRRERSETLPIGEAARRRERSLSPDEGPALRRRRHHQ
jgi:hypothetical protein